MGRVSLLKYEKGSGRGSASSCLCAGGYEEAGGRESRIRMGEELKRKKKGGEREKEKKQVMKMNRSGGTP